ncbi:MAG TPA: hypothetical protein VE954_34105 [Oligoflexus sp.]|uniref:hypothetical protein n=1 Tax=Oligoflexus sp. TaxID=1971216 RepID=UPI002D48B8DD|nr:hypothetical protein [Oligoflexus sp.]HYX38162.1 hypothetical protein [Oligoflexus sp.]
MTVRTFLSLILGLQLTLSTSALALTAKPSGRVLDLPPRPKNAMTGSAFVNKIKNLAPAKREKAIVAEILKGNIPNFQRFLTPVERRLTAGPYRGQILRFWAVPDYLAIGSDRDYVRVPLNMYSVKALAQKLDLSLPTAKMVDDIYAQAKVKLKPAPLPANKAITSAGNIMKHHSLVQNQLNSSNWRPGLLVAGHKKDVVQSRRLTKKPGAIAIYGWHQKNSTPIQPLSTVHSADYADYSHGIRLVSNAVEIGTRTLDLRDALSQSPTASLLSDEGVIPQPYHISGRSTFPMASQ